MGEWATAGNGDGARVIATKWLNRIAQGFSPGFVDDRGRALKGRPNENRVCPSFRQPRILKLVRLARAWPA